MAETHKHWTFGKYLLFIALLSRIATAAEPVSSKSRVWKSDVGTSLEATFVKGGKAGTKRNGFAVLRDPKGRTLRVELSRLSDESSDVAMELIEWQELREKLARQPDMKNDHEERQLRNSLRSALVSGESKAVRDALNLIQSQCILAAKDCPDLDYIAGGKCFENGERLQTLGVRKPRESLVRKLQLEAIRLLGVTRSKRSWYTISQLRKSKDPVVKVAAEEAADRIGELTLSEQLWSKYFRSLVLGEKFLYFAPPIRMSPGESPKGKSQFWLPSIWEVRSKIGASAVEVSEYSERGSDPKFAVDLVSQAIRLRKMIESKGSWPWFWGESHPRPILIAEADYEVGDRTDVMACCEIGYSFGQSVVVPCIPALLSHADFERLIFLLANPGQHVKLSTPINIPEDLQLFIAERMSAEDDLAAPPKAPSPVETTEDDALNPILAKSVPIRGEWSKSSNALLGKSGSATQLPVGSESSYRLSMDFEKKGNDAVVCLLPVAETNVQMILDAEHGKYHGFAHIDDRFVDVNSTGVDAKAFGTEGTCSLKISVRIKGKVAYLEALLNGQTVAKWNGRYARLSSGPRWVCPDRTKIGIATTNCEISIFGIDFEDASNPVLP